MIEDNSHRSRYIKKSYVLLFQYTVMREMRVFIDSKIQILM